MDGDCKTCDNEQQTDCDRWDGANWKSLFIFENTRRIRQKLKPEEKTYLKTVFFWICTGGIFAVWLLPLLLTQFSLVDYSQTEPIGDTIGGISNPFIGLLTAILTFLAFYVQYQANQQQRKILALAYKIFFYGIGPTSELNYSENLNKREKIILERFIESQKPIETYPDKKPGNWIGCQYVLFQIGVKRSWWVKNKKHGSDNHITNQLQNFIKAIYLYNYIII